MNNFKNELKVEPITQEDKSKIFANYKKEELEKHRKIYSDKQIQEYFHYVISSIMITQNEYYEYYGINIPYRFKSQQSMSKKLDKKLQKATISYDENNKPVVNVKPILDALAMKVILRSRPPTFSSTDPKIKKLLEKEKEKRIFIEEMQNFKTRLVEDEYTKPENYKYKYECTKIEYYENCKKLLEHTRELINPKSVNLMAKYDNQILNINNRLDFLYATSSKDTSELITYEDLAESEINFFKILSQYENSVYNKTNLAILHKQFLSMFENNEIFEQLGISLSSVPSKEKRTENGFEADFIYIDTLFGVIECQLQTEDQYRSGNYGHAAHTKLKGKAIKPLPIPNTKDKEQINKFIQEINRICPKGYFARMDDNELGRVMIQEYNDYQNYKNLISQVSKGDPLEKFLFNYFDKLYTIRHRIFQSKENSMAFMEYDIKEYINSNTFKSLKEKAIMNKTKADEKEK